MVANNSLLVLLLLKFSKIFVQMKKKSSCIMVQKLFFILFTSDDRTYVIHLLGTYVTILCNWLILWKKRTLLVIR